MEIKITNFSQECVICDRNGEEGIVEILIQESRLRLSHSQQCQVGRDEQNELSQGLQAQHALIFHVLHA